MERNYNNPLWAAFLSACFYGSRWNLREKIETVKGWLYKPVEWCLPPDYLVCTYERGWIHIRDLKEGEAVRGYGATPLPRRDSHLS